MRISDWSSDVCSSDLINEEVDALTVMAVPSVPYLVTTRVIAGFIAILPLYTIGLLTSYAGSRMNTVLFYGQSAGTYDHYRSEERRGGKECASTCRSWGAPCHKKKKEKKVEIRR